MTELAHIATRVFNAPLFMHPEKADAILWALRERFGATIDAEPPKSSAFTGSRKGEDGSYKLSRRTGGVAVIRVHGSLVNRGGWVDAYSGVTSYEGIKAQVMEAARDAEVTSIVLDIDSPGGEATGMFALAQTIRAAAKRKHVVAVVDDMAASAAYGIASAATEVAISPTSMVGSIGVVWLHLDRSAEMMQRGVKPTLVFAGAHKVDAHPFAGLSDSVRADVQKTVNQFYEQFLASVSAGRGARLTTEAAKATEARVFIGQDAISAGLADRMANFDEVISSLANKAPGKGRKIGAIKMDETISLETHRAEVTRARTEGEAAGRAAAVANNEAATKSAVDAAVAEERARITGILGCEEAKGRAETALQLAATGMSIEQAKPILNTVTPAKAENPASLENRMGNQPASPLSPGANHPAPGGQEAVKSLWKAATARANGRFEQTAI